MFTESEFALLAREVKSRSGALLSPADGAAIAARLVPLQRREGYGGMSDLITAARAAPALWQTVTETLVDSKTCFFRDRDLFKALREEIAPTLMSRRNGRLRIWSAGCGTGQEAFSLSILMEELRAEGLPGGDIVATDFCTGALEKARAGVFTQFEVQRGLPIRTLLAHFEKIAELWRIHDRVRALIQFEKRNLVEPMPSGAFDLILCCNVLGAMAPDCRAQALENVTAALAPGGVLATDQPLETGGSLTQLRAGLYQSTGAQRAAA
jgi:chemotaxis protein methyltransferase CheR